MLSLVSIIILPLVSDHTGMSLIILSLVSVIILSLVYNHTVIPVAQHYARTSLRVRTLHVPVHILVVPRYIEQMP